MSFAITSMEMDCFNLKLLDSACKAIATFNQTSFSSLDEAKALLKELVYNISYTQLDGRLYSAYHFKETGHVSVSLFCKDGDQPLPTGRSTHLTISFHYAY